MAVPLILNKKYLYTISIIAAFSGFVSSYSMSVMTGALPFINDYFQLNAFQLGMLTSSLAIGAIIGAAFTGSLPDRLGRRKTLKLASMLYIIAALFVGFSFTWYDFMLYRIICGIAVGLTSIVTPMYLAELAPTEKRGMMVTLYQLAIVIGIMTSYIIDYLLTGFEHNWRLMMGAAFIPSVSMFVLLSYLPDSPRWLVIKERFEEARKVLEKVGGDAYANDTISSYRSSITIPRQRSFMELTQKPFLKVLIAGMVLTIIQQWSGTNLVFSYSPMIFQSAGFNVNDAVFQTILIGIVNFAATLFSIVLIQKFGRKVLLTWGLGWNVVSLGLIGTYFLLKLDIPWLLVTAALISVASFAITLGPVMWIVIAEISPSQIRSQAMSIYIFALWTAGMLGVFSFPLLQQWMGSEGVFFMYVGICIASMVFISLYIPETKDKTLEEIESLWE